MHKITKRNILYGMGFLLLIILSIKLAFQKTIQAKGQVKVLTEEVRRATNLNQEVDALNLKKIKIDSLLNHFDLDIDFSEHKLLDLINEFKNGKNLKTLSFGNPNISTDKHLTTYSTYEIIFSGNFKDLIEMIYLLEYEKRVGKIISLKIEKQKKANSLIGTIYLQRISSL